MTRERIHSSPETADRVLRELESRAEDNEASASVPDLAEMLGIGKTTALNALARLEDEGHISLARRGTSKGYPSRWKIEA